MWHFVEYIIQNDSTCRCDNGRGHPDVRVWVASVFWKDPDVDLQWWLLPVRLCILNKKVLLRKHKRHTDRSVSSTPSVKYSICYPVRGGPGPTGGYPRWGTPWPGLMGGTPWWGTPQPGPMGEVPEVGYSPRGRVPPPSGYLPCWTWQG